MKLPGGGQSKQGITNTRSVKRMEKSKMKKKREYTVEKEKEKDRWGIVEGILYKGSAIRREKY